MDFSKFTFCVIKNARLDFRNSSEAVEAFIAKRMECFSAKHEFFSDRASLELYIRNLQKSSQTTITHLVLMDIMCPFTDFELVEYMSSVLIKNNNDFCKPEGAVPGTEVIGILSLDQLDKNIPFEISSFVAERNKSIQWRTQEKFNNQLNLYKYKRLKLFLELIRQYEIYELSVSEIIAFLSKDDVLKLLLNFGNQARQFSYEKCPHCQGSLSPLTNTMSQPFCGYIPSNRSIYHECIGCGLVVLSPAVDENDVHMIYDEWDKQDFVRSTNNPYNKDSIRCNFEKITDLIPEKARSLDLGGGIGNFSKFLLSQYPNWIVTHSDFEIKAEAGDGIISRSLDFTQSPIGDEEYNLITAWEVIEHVPYHKLEFILNNIWKALKPGGFFIFSTPDFDSPLCKSFDFYALCPPFHYLVFGEKWLRSYFENMNQFDIYDIKHCSDFLDDALNWYSYGEVTCPSMAIRGTSTLLRRIFELDSDGNLRKALSGSGIGTEVVMTLRKPETQHS